LLFGFIASATIASVWFLLRETTKSGSSTALAAVRIDAIKTGLAVGAGATGIVALILAYRRQRLGERAQAHAEKVAADEKDHQERVASDATHDATERRITELYTKAVELLGSEKATVRLGAVYALERVAQANPEHRQTVVNVVCSYLRMPFSWPPVAQEDGEASSIEVSRAREEFQVRQAAQRVLVAHLRPNKSYPDVWESLEIDLAGAILVDFDFDRCCVSTATFSQAIFVGGASFEDAVSDGEANFRLARFPGDVSFSGMVFNGPTSIEDVAFLADVDLTRTTWKSGARFDRTVFAKPTMFGEATFHGFTSFSDVTFQGNVSFADASFDGTAWFQGALFEDLAWFGKATFSDDARFAQAEFRGVAWFAGLQFPRMAEFSEATFRRAVTYAGARFVEAARFDSTRFIQDAIFSDVDFDGRPSFRDTSFEGDTSFVGSSFDLDGADAEGSTFKGELWIKDSPE